MSLENDIKTELEKTSEKHHIIGAWIAIIFDPFFALTDYINIPSDWYKIFILRVFISLTTLILVLNRKKKNIPSYLIVLVPFVLISLQNAYTFQFLSNDDITGHTLNYLALFIVAGLFILWKWHYTVAIVTLSTLATAIAVSLNNNIDFKPFFVKGGGLLLMVSVLSIILIQARYSLTLKEIVSRLNLKESNKKLELQTRKTEEKNKKITESITYAERIQSSIIGSNQKLKNMFPESFILFKPKDILSGDFYYFYMSPVSETKVVVVADCTGHGVPAALMTVLGMNALTNIVEQQKVFDPGKILSLLDQKIKTAFSNKGSSYTINDGMDASVLVFKDKKTFFSGALNPLFIVKKTGEAERIKGTRNTIGGNPNVCNLFKTVELDTYKGDKLYLFSDGFQDQYGGPHFKKFMSKTFRKTIHETSNSLHMESQNEELCKQLTDWKGDFDQTDDILVLGIEI